METFFDDYKTLSSPKSAADCGQQFSIGELSTAEGAFSSLSFILCHLCVLSLFQFKQVVPYLPGGTRLLSQDWGVGCRRVRDLRPARLHETLSLKITT